MLIIAHLVLAVASILISFSLVMERFDSGGDASQFEVLATALSNILLSPMSFLSIKGLSSLLQWAIVLGNSILWGAVLTVPVWLWARLVWKDKRSRVQF
jgi:hypothetical protein